MEVSDRICRGRPACRPGHSSSRDPSAGGHIGPPLRGGGGVPNQRKIGAKTGPCLRGGTEPAPYRRQEQNGCGGVRLGCGFRRPNFVPKFGASVMGIGPYALWGDGTPGSSYPTDGCGEPPRLPRSAAHSGASAPRSRGMGGSRSRDHPHRGYQPRTIPQSAFGRQLPLHKGALPCGGREMRIAASLRSSQ